MNSMRINNKKIPYFSKIFICVIFPRFLYDRLIPYKFYGIISIALVLSDTISFFRDHSHGSDI